MLAELKEEANVLAVKPKQIGMLHFEFEGQEKIFEVHVFLANDFKGEVKESEEMVRHEWFA